MDKFNYGQNRWKVILGKYSGIERTAIDILYGIVSEHTGYILTLENSDSQNDSDLENFNPIFIGTKKSNHFIKQFIQNGIIKMNNEAEGYSIKIMESIFNKDRQMIIIAGNDENGLIYGAIDFENRYLVNTMLFTSETTQYFKKPFNNVMPEFELISAPKVRDRAIWTWGHVIYDYRRFLDNMMKLKLNMIVVWNDFAPLNSKEFVRYAHSRGIRVIWGYSWGWGEEIDISNRADMAKWTEIALSTYEENYLQTGGDGIYFQSFTETEKDTINGTIIAQSVVEWVNLIGEKLLSKYPDLQIQFGLHATSVRERLDYLKNIDQRISIIWEDCGSFPYSYTPNAIENYDETMTFSSKISCLRGSNEKFGAVLKGLICLDWRYFEHQKGSFVMGMASEKSIAERTEQKAKYWRYVQAYWLRNAAYALDLIRLLVAAKGRELTVQALVEDGMLEGRLWFPVALYSEMLWDCDADIRDIMCRTALLAGVEFA